MNRFNLYRNIPLGYKKNNNTRDIINNNVDDVKVDKSNNSNNQINYLNSPIITGEKVQSLANVYLGLDQDFSYNPFFSSPEYKVKKYNLSNIGEDNPTYNNPRIIFCFTHRIDMLATKIKFFQNNFILLTHNSDGEVKDTEIVRSILNSDKLEKWFTQNLLIDNTIQPYNSFPYNKLNVIPIGIANIQWKHGRDFIESQFNNLNNVKDKKVYMSFNINTNKKERKPCYDILSKKIQFLNDVDSLKNFDRMSKYQYCICPDGNGVDTHRFWEAIYLKLVPIVIRNSFYNMLENKVPMVILNRWEEFDLDKLPDYNSFNFHDISINNISDMNYYKNLITP
jgi:hypothetical protein